MDIIYQPNGAAYEYAKLALNHYKGCTHGCKYCFAPSALRCGDRSVYYAEAKPKQDVVARVQKDCRKLTSDCPEILLSFIGDPYQHAEVELGLTREILQVLIRHSLPFTILTKGGTRAVRDFDLLGKYSRGRFGTTLIFSHQADADQWEPNAAPIENRIQAIREAHRRGIRTWVSLEPVIEPEQALELISMLYGVVNHWKVGKINYNKEVERRVDWLKFREDVKGLLDGLGADYYLKNSLTKLKA
jgi:DNA repair photolyase